MSRLKIAIRFLPAILLFIAVPVTCFSATIYVTTTGNDTTGDGSAGAPYRTVNKAFTVVSANDTISVAAGTYTDGTAGENFSITNTVNNITLQGAGSSNTTLNFNGTTKSINFNGVAGGKIDGFSFTNIGDSSFITVVPSGATATTAMVVSNNIFYNSSGMTGQAISFGGTTANSSGTINNNIFYNLNATIKVSGATSNTGTVTITDNTFYNISYAILLVNSTQNITAKNNISFEHASYAYGSSGSSGTFTSSYNCGYSTVAGANFWGVTKGAGDIESSPQLVNPAAGNFRLKSAYQGAYNVHSPGIDGGDPADSVGLEPAPNGGIINMGYDGGTSTAAQSITKINTVYVDDTSGSDTTGNGSQSNPFKTISMGVSYLNTNGTINIAAGTYNSSDGESFPLSPLTGVTFKGAGSTLTTIQGDGVNPVLSFTASDMTIQDLKIDGKGYNSAIVNGASGTGNSIISNLIVFDSLGVTNGSFGILLYTGTSSSTIKNCIIYNCDAGFTPGSNAVGAGINIYNSVAYGCTGTSNGTGFLLATIGADLTVNLYNSIANNCTTGVKHADFGGGTAALTENQNCFYNNTTNYGTLNGVPIVPGANDITLNPFFIDASAYNFRLQTKTLGYAFDSPCIDSGTSSGAPTTDIEGTTRPQGSAFDIGAYEALDKSSLHSSVSKAANKKKATVGDIVTYTLTIKSPATQSVVNAQLVDVTPKGFKYINGTTTLNNVKQADPAGTTTRTFTLGTLAANTTYTLKYKLVVGSGVDFGDYTNTATLYSTSDNTLSGTAKETVTIVANPLFYTATILGKVYNDQNKNQVQDNGEEGLPDIELGLETGLRVKTDAYGRFHIENLKPQTHIIGLDTTTLPKGSKLTTPNPVLLTAVTEAIPLKANFGVYIPEEKIK